jgi:hypothetical protein
MYFEDWRTEKQSSYCILSYLPAELDPRYITVDLSPETGCITYDPTTATLDLRGLENWRDCCVRVHVHGPFTLDDLFFITHPTAGPDFGYKSPFDACQEEEWKEQCEREGGLWLGTTWMPSSVAVPGSFRLVKSGGA